MNSIKTAFCSALLVVSGLAAAPATAQTKLTNEAIPNIITPHRQSVSYRERTLCYEITANVPFTTSCSESWVTLDQKADGTVFVHVDENLSPASRQATIVFANADNGITQNLVLTQSRNESIEELTSDTQVKVSGATADNQYSGNSIALSYDGKFNTFYHSNYPNHPVTESSPATLIYSFSGTPHIDYVNYSTRMDGTANGYFGKVEVYAQCGTATDFTKVGDVDFGETAGTHRYTFPGGLDKVKKIKFVVLSGSNDFACCSEMQFFVDNRKNISTVFADDLYTTLKPGTTQDDIDAVSDDFISGLAQQMFDGNYDTTGRVAEYDAKLSVYTQSDLWNAPGKYYDQTQGVTGINITKGKHAVAVSGLADGQTLPLTVVAWYVGKVGSNFDGGDPVSESFNLSNGLNVIDYTNDYDGLAYVAYYADTNPELLPKVKVHFINGQVNGYLSLDKTNDEMHEICANATNTCLDVVGTHVHSVWTAKGVADQPNLSKGLYSHCVALDGKSLGYRQFIHVLDSLVIWEHKLLGFEKYDRLPDNRTMAYVNFTYYMFQGGRGVSFHVNQESRVLSCKNLITGDNDAIWGLSHEWGHQHQMQPYFCWAGMGEVTNNMNSYYNIMRMGYRESDKINNWAAARKHFVDANYSGLTLVSTVRHNAYEAASTFSYSSDMKALCLAMKDSTIKKFSVDPTLALSINEVGVGEMLCPFIMLYNYFTTHGFPDFAPDWYEALRQNDDENGSQIEKQGEVDKYELIASAQNNNKNGKYSVLKEKYPNSSWITRGYVQASSSNRWENSAPYVLNFIRKTSRLSGYNLMPYFERWGFLRQVALCIGDYGNKWFVLTKTMYDEFKNDMDALVDSGELKTMPDGMVEEISNSADMFQTRPTFEN